MEVKVLWDSVELWSFILPLDQTDRIFLLIIQSIFVIEPSSRIDRMPVVVSHLPQPPLEQASQNNGTKISTGYPSFIHVIVSVISILQELQIPLVKFLLIFPHPEFF
jgi:hypothetical protein